MLTVRDTGSGMTPAIQERIFEPFFTTKDAGKGTGLGLSTVYGIVQQSKGHITVHSKVGKGTRFKVYFPIVDGALVDIPRKQLTRPAGGTETILLVEDEDSLRAVVADTLRANGYVVLEAHDGSNGIEFAGRFDAPIDLLLTDVILPGATGREVAHRLLAFRPEMKVIYMSGYTDDFIADHGIVDPETVLLEKPFPIALLLLRVRETLDRKPAGGRRAAAGH
jgi:CheY-like chemotaxis protein